MPVPWLQKMSPQRRLWPEILQQFYDFIPIGDHRLGIAIGDVSDHGVPAALFMAMTVTLLRAEARRLSAPSPKEILLNVNKQLLEMNEMGIFVTMLYGELD